MGDVINEYVRSMKIAAGLNEQLVYDAWDAVSGVSEYTVSKYLKNGVLYCSLSSSVVRSRLFPRRDELVRKINAYLLEDERAVTRSAFHESVEQWLRVAQQETVGVLIHLFYLLVYAAQQTQLAQVAFGHFYAAIDT